MKEHNIKQDNIAAVRFEIEMILHELGFPPETLVRSFWHDRDNPLTINIAVIHPDLPAVKQGDKLPEITPLFFRSHENEKSKLVDWGIEDEHYRTPSP